MLQYLDLAQRRVLREAEFPHVHRARCGCAASGLVRPAKPFEMLKWFESLAFLSNRAAREASAAYS